MVREADGVRIKECLTCQETFVVKTPWQVHCSGRCRKRSYDERNPRIQLSMLTPTGQLEVRDRRRAHTRRSDPETSREAAATVEVRESQNQVMDVFGLHEAMTDTDLILHAETMDIQQSPSGLRTRRRELVDLGMLYNTGQREILPSGRRSIVWGLMTWTTMSEPPVSITQSQGASQGA